LLFTSAVGGVVTVGVVDGKAQILSLVVCLNLISKHLL